MQAHKVSGTCVVSHTSSGTCSQSYSSAAYIHTPTIWKKGVIRAFLHVMYLALYAHNLRMDMANLLGYHNIPSEDYQVISVLINFIIYYNSHFHINFTCSGFLSTSIYFCVTEQASTTYPANNVKLAQYINIILY